MAFSFFCGFVFVSLCLSQNIIEGAPHCSSNIPYPSITTDLSHQTQQHSQYHVATTAPMLLQRIEFDTTNCQLDRELAEHTATVTFVDYSDGMNTSNVYAESLPFVWSNSDVIMLTFDDILYTDNVTLSINSPGYQCSTVTLIGCQEHDLCSPSSCQNGGTCTGYDRCACSIGYYGKHCENTIYNFTSNRGCDPQPSFDCLSCEVSNLETADFNFEDLTHSVITTPSGVLEVTGHVKLNGEHGGHGVATFTGNNDTLVYSWSNTNNTYNPLQHQTMLSPLEEGFTFLVSLALEKDHDHDKEFHLFTTQRESLSKGVALYYSNYMLHMSVQTDTHFYSLKVPFSDTTITQNITSSFSPQLGIELFINGSLVGSQYRPEERKPALTKRHWWSHNHHSFCLGHCWWQHLGINLGAGHHHHHNHHHAHVSSLYHIGTSVSNIVRNVNQLVSSTVCVALQNALGGIFGHCGTHHNNIITAKPQTTKPPQTAQLTTTTNKPPQTAFTPKPTTVMKVTATTAIKTTSSLMCYQCSQMAVDGTCKLLATCSAGEVCAVFKDTLGFTYKCLDKQVCDLGKQLSTTNCWHCCSGSLCNHNCPVPCMDKPDCAVLASTGYNVCGDQTLATTSCKKTCGHCPSLG